jgi:precorrin-3B C17-methyltransferase
MGQLTLVGLGPGGPEHLTAAAIAALREADVVVGYRLYVEQIRELIPNIEAREYAIGDEIERARQAVDLATSGYRVALVSSGDTGIYGMAAPAFDVLAERDWNGSDPGLTVIPGVSAAQAAAALLGAPLGHDFCSISLSDLLTPWAVIERRVRAAAAR